jgi:hypothetical protein
MFIVLDTVFKADGHLEVAAPVVEKATVEEVKVVAEPAVEAVTETTTSTTSSAGHSSISERSVAVSAAEAAAETATESPLTTIPSLANLLDKAEEIQEQEAEVLFAGGVDQDIDNLFSDLTPPEAQQEVEKIVEPAPLPWNDPIAALEFPKTVEVDLSPLLSEPLETAQEAEQSLSAPVQIEEPEEEEEISGSLFDGGLDTDIDNIFSELAPPEAQQEVARVVEPTKPAEVKFPDDFDFVARSNDLPIPVLINVL